MALSTNLRFRLQRYSGPKSRTACPSCGRPHCFTSYLDTDTGEMLPDEYGRCDHEVSCGYNRTPYQPEAAGLSYAATVALGERPAAGHPAPRRRTVAPAPPPIVSIPAEVLAASLAHYEANTFALLLRQHFGAGVADGLLARFQVGTSEHWPGACVFWYIDEQGRARGGKILLYDDTFHRVKSTPPTWVHNALADACQRRNQPLPDWFAAYEAKDNPKSPCLFGLPQLSTNPVGLPVALVESEKTAILATPYLPQYTWLATGSKSQLTAERLAPLRGRRLVLFPDAGALNDWQNKADGLTRLGFDVTVSDEMEKLSIEDPTLASGDLADVLLREWPGYPPSWDERE